MRSTTGRSLCRVGMLLLAASSSATAQGAAPTDIHLVPVTMRGSGITLGTPINITARPGYDNQPSFTLDGGAILYTGIRADGQADIYRYDVGSRRTTRVTETPESEYSATVMPGGARISVIRVEADSTQRLWSFDLQGRDPRVVLDAIKPVGYHAWADDSTLALFVLGSPPTLQVANARTGSAHSVLSGIGRSIHRIPDSEGISFVHKVAPDDWWVKRLDIGTHGTVALTRTLPGSEDHAWLPDGSMLMARADSLFRWSPARPNTAAQPGTPARDGSAASGWQLVTVFTDPALRRISRLAVSPRGDYLALVSAEPAAR